MKIRLMWVGKTKERFIEEGIRKYAALLKPYADVRITEIKEEKGKDIQKMLEKEGGRIMKSGPPYVLLDEKGKCLTSVQFADFMGRHAGNIAFLLGGAYGVSREVKEAARETIALSKMTLTHEMSRLLLMEQIFRAYTIIHKRGYHH
jgi:23S rRNA (pseudouridine1915-N3)-methyltransferase